MPKNNALCIKKKKKKKINLLLYLMDGPIYRQRCRDQPELDFQLLVDLEVMSKFYLYSDILSDWTKNPIHILLGIGLLIKLYLD
jgi:hypothetical protein